MRGPLAPTHLPQDAFGGCLVLCERASEGGDHVGQLCIDGDKRDYDTRKAERLGYYSVEDTANMADLKPVRLKITSLNLLNDEALMTMLNWEARCAANQKLDELIQAVRERKP